MFFFILLLYLVHASFQIFFRKYEPFKFNGLFMTNVTFLDKQIGMDMRVVLLLAFMVSMSLAKDLRMPFYDYEGNDEV